MGLSTNRSERRKLARNKTKIEDEKTKKKQTIRILLILLMVLLYLLIYGLMFISKHTGTAINHKLSTIIQLYARDPILRVGL